MLNIEKITNDYTDKIMSIINEFDNENVEQMFADEEIGKSQLDILLKAVRSANSVDEIILFISYQKSKAKDEESWKYKVGDKTFADFLIEKLKKVIDLASNEEICKKLTDNSEEELRILKLKFCEKFLGYFYWKGSVLMNNN